MTQAELNRAVAQVTGESVARIKRLGFLLADSEIEIADLGSEEHGPHIVDWDVAAARLQGDFERTYTLIDPVEE